MSGSGNQSTLTHQPDRSSPRSTGTIAFRQLEARMKVTRFSTESIHEANAWTLARHMVAMDCLHVTDPCIHIFSRHLLSAAFAVPADPLCLLRLQPLRRRRQRKGGSGSMKPQACLFVAGNPEIPPKPGGQKILQRTRITPLRLLQIACSNLVTHSSSSRRCDACGPASGGYLLR